MGHMTHDDVALRWMWNCLGKRPDNRAARNHNMFAEGDTLYSYGHHFALAQCVRDKAREPVVFLVNGDTYSNTTAKHQSATRSAVALSSVPSLIIPFSVLDAAGIDHDSVRLLDASSDTWEETHHTSEVEPAGSRWRIHDVGMRLDEFDHHWEARIAKRTKDNLDEWRRDVHRLLWPELDTYSSAYTRHRVFTNTSRQPKVETRHTMPREHSRWYPALAQERRLYTSGTSRTEITVHVEPDGSKLYAWTTRRHWLGESLIEAEVPYTVTLTCKACGGTGARPGVREDEYDSRSMACDQCMRFSWNDRWRGSGRNTLMRRRKAKFLSGFDRGETRPSYFFTELPKTDAVTIEEAIEALKPDTVRMAEQMGREVSRQGDIFAVPLEHLDKRAVRQLGVREFVKRGNLLGTNHEATEVAYLKDGRTLARGTLTHAPDFRPPDHRRVTLAKGKWHLIVKNTVPLSA